MVVIELCARVVRAEAVCWVVVVVIKTLLIVTVPVSVVTEVEIVVLVAEVTAMVR